LAQYLNRSPNTESGTPCSQLFGVMLNVTGSAEPLDLQWSTVILVVPVSSLRSARTTRLLLRKSLPCSQSSEHPCPILRIVAIAISTILLDSFGVTFVVCSVHSTDRVTSRDAQVAASFRAESTNALGRAEESSAVFARFGFHPSTIAFAQRIIKSSASYSVPRKKRDAPLICSSRIAPASSSRISQATSATPSPNLT
jgi:hypothetical protein